MVDFWGQFSTSLVYDFYLSSTIIMEVSPLIQNASPGEWKLAIEAGLSYKSNRLRSEAKKYFVGGPFASAELMDFISTLHNGEIET